MLEENGFVICSDYTLRSMSTKELEAELETAKKQLAETFSMFREYEIRIKQELQFRYNGTRSENKVVKIAINEQK